jgi:hypothetical protein
VNKRILTLCLTLLAITILVLPVLGEPRKAEDKNDIPNAEIIESVFGMGIHELTQILPSGVIHNWVYFPLSTIHTKVMPKDKCSIPAVANVGDTYGLWLNNPLYTGKWVEMSKTGYIALQTDFGFLDYPFDLIPEEGIYIMAN